MGTFRNPVGPLPSSIYWRRRLVVLGVPLFVILLIAYACSGTSGTPQNTSGAIGAQTSAGPGGGAVITPAPSQTESGPAGGSYPGGGPGGGNGSAGGTTAAVGTTGSAAAGSAGGATGGGGGTGCVLALSLALDRTSTSASGLVAYPAGTYPTFKITGTDSGSANCTVDVSGRTLVVTVSAQGSSTPKWTSVTCSGDSDLRVLGPSDSQTFPVQWKRWESQGQTCPVAKLPTVSPGTYTVSASVDGVAAKPVSFVLD